MSQRKKYRGGRPNPVWLLPVLFTVTMMCSAVVAADPVNLFFLVSKPTTDYLEVLATVQDNLTETFPGKYSYTVEFASEKTNSNAAESNTLGSKALEFEAVAAASPIAAADFIITIGTVAADRAYQAQPKVPMISVLITDNAFSVLASKHYGSVDQAFRNQVSAICIDQPTDRSIRLAKLLLPEAKTVGVMLGLSSVERREELAADIQAAGLQAEFVTIGSNDNPINKIEPLMRNADVFIPVPDTRLINIATAKWILHLSYRYKVPVIAFSRTYAKAGALAAIYSSPHNVALQTAEWIADRAVSKAISGQAYPPKYYSMDFNYSVAASLNVAIKSDQFYREQMHKEAQ